MILTSQPMSREPTVSSVIRISHHFALYFSRWFRLCAKLHASLESSGRIIGLNRPSRQRQPRGCLLAGRLSRSRNFEHRVPAIRARLAGGRGRLKAQSYSETDTFGGAKQRALSDKCTLRAEDRDTAGRSCPPSPRAVVFAPASVQRAAASR